MRDSCSHALAPVTAASMPRSAHGPGAPRECCCAGGQCCTHPRDLQAHNVQRALGQRFFRMCARTTRPRARLRGGGSGLSGGARELHGAFACSGFDRSLHTLPVVGRPHRCSFALRSRGGTSAPSARGPGTQRVLPACTTCSSAARHAPLGARMGVGVTWASCAREVGPQAASSAHWQPTPLPGDCKRR